MAEIIFNGCTSRPLVAYLKALGILRLVSEQKDSNACGAWRHDGYFILFSSLDRQDICDFFLNDWHPTPVVSPWNAGSGFYPKKGDEYSGLNLILQSNNPRLREYKDVISRILKWNEIRDFGKCLKDERKDDLKKKKSRILQLCRSELPEVCLSWLDAAYILNANQFKFSPLLRTGGNEGNLEYSSHFMQHVDTVLSSSTEKPVKNWLQSALFATASCLPKKPKPTGQFDPGRAGGCNQGNGFFVKKAPVNPWDFILMLEGALLFAGAIVRRSPADPAQVSFPFSVQNLFAGFSSSSVKTKSAGEIWLPLWSQPASLREVRRLLGEGRATLNRCQAANALDFAQSIASLGVERGIEQFERYSFLERRGESYVALPAGRLSVRYRPEVSLLEPVTRWLELSKHKKDKKKEEPATLTSARRQLSAALFACAHTPDVYHFQAVSRALAHMDALPNLSTLLKAPCSDLSDSWISVCDDAKPEVRIAAALASLKREKKLGSLRAQIAPIDPYYQSRWAEKEDQYVCGRATSLEFIGKLFLHRLLLAQRFGVTPFNASVNLQPADLMPLLQNTVDFALLQDLVRAFSLVQSHSLPECWKKPLRSQRLPHALALLKLLYTPLPNDCGLDTKRLHPELRIARLVQANRLEEACMLAAQRVRIAGGTGIYLPASFAESVRGMSSASVLACLAVPVDSRALLRDLYQYNAERSYHVAG